MAPSAPEPPERSSPRPSKPAWLAEANELEREKTPHHDLVARKRDEAHHLLRQAAPGACVGWLMRHGRGGNRDVMALLRELGRFMPRAVA
ncbi:hypothetical protein JCM4814A_93760 [Streptomyces phaeofaciens JCM 4814]|uniref:Uncharacterized protein n=1 Tax=Streptomyces phaeofaciens TaxID=68254 RepID=A0A918M147_9ACTN|nr:hypothetical protein GCM10010226_89320 [Streptomyces phaeofaciens]